LLVHVLLMTRTTLIRPCLSSISSAFELIQILFIVIHLLTLMLVIHQLY